MKCYLLLLHQISLVPYNICHFPSVFNNLLILFLIKVFKARYKKLIMNVPNCYKDSFLFLFRHYYNKFMYYIFRLNIMHSEMALLKS